MFPDVVPSSCIVLLSGGLDSALCLATMHAASTVKMALTVNYGQRAFPMELKAAHALCAHYNVPHEVLELPWYQSLLPDAMRAASNHKWAGEATGDDEQTDSFFDAKPVWVPNRNGVLLNIAAAYAEALGAEAVVFGANAEEGERFPDNTPAYREKLSAALADSTLSGVRVYCPVETMHKSAMVQVAQTIEMPLQLVWSCYGAGPEPCGVCPSCFRLKAAMQSIVI